MQKQMETEEIELNSRLDGMLANDDDEGGVSGQSAGIHMMGDTCRYGP